MDTKVRHWWVYILIFIVSQLTSVALIFLMGSRLSIGQTQSLGLFAANALAILLFFAYRPPQVSTSAVLAGMRGDKGRRSLLMLLLAIPVAILSNILQEAFFPDILNLVDDETMASIIENPIGLFTIAVLGPIAEELLFRGGVQTNILERHPEQGWPVAIGLSAAIFSLAHMNPAQLPITFVLGLLLGYAYWWTGSLAAPILIHIFNNASACALTLLFPEESGIINLLGGTAPTVAMAAVCVVWGGAAARAIRKHAQKS